MIDFDELYQKFNEEKKSRKITGKSKPLIVKIFGPPGTGKTTALIRDWYKPFFEKFPDQIAIVSLTRATTRAFQNAARKQGIKLELGNDRKCRTMHSWCFKAVKKINPDFVLFEKNTEIIKKCFADLFKRSIDDDTAELVAESLENINETSEYNLNIDAAIFQAFARVRTTYDLTEPFEIHMRKFFEKERENFDFFSFAEFREKFFEFQKWKEDNNVFDFTDLLLFALKGDIDPFAWLPGKLIIMVDEVQDLYPLAFRVFEKYMVDFDTVIVAGDDDQTIYAFTGAKPDYFLELPGYSVVLDQSYRLPKTVHQYSLNLISQNKNRLDKFFQPDDRDGEVYGIKLKTLHTILEKDKKPTMILARTNFLVQNWHKYLTKHDIPHRVTNGGRISEKIPSFVLIHESLKQNKEIKGQTKEYIDKFFDEIVFPFVKVQHNKVRLQKNEKETIKKAILEKDPLSAGIFYLAVQEFFSNNLSEICLKVEKLKTLSSVFEIWQERFKTGKLEEWMNPCLTVGTIHSAKGLESDRVIIDPRITPRVAISMIESRDNEEAERRVWYVACTRAKKELYILEETPPAECSCSFYPLPRVENLEVGKFEDINDKENELWLSMYY